ncbi:MAG: dephospho-CoA kinase, partial [Candidatus Dadabacteria bacterium]|nr:dephospho-CoA kinase [Candidatus Dadabacteria bacterium]
PLVYAEIDNKVTLLNAPYCVISIPLLIETNALDKVDRVLVVDIPDALQIDRASKRDGVDISEITKILNAQVKRKKRLDIADDIIKNDGDIDNLRIQVENLHKIYLAMANDNLA